MRIAISSILHSYNEQLHLASRPRTKCIHPPSTAKPQRPKNNNTDNTNKKSYLADAANLRHILPTSKVDPEFPTLAQSQPMESASPPPPGPPPCRISLGQTMQPRSEVDAESSCPFGRWSEIQGAAFKVRDGPNYGAERKKAPSEFSIYKPVYIEVHKAPRKVFHVARFFDYSVMVDSLEDSGPFPKVLILNVICPLYSPGIWSSVEDGECFLFTVFCKISEEAVKKIEKEQLTPGMKLLNAFFESDPADTQWNNRLKFIARATNVSELSLGPILSGLVSRYNGTPFLLYGNKKEVFVHKKDKEYIEFDIDMNRFNVLARNGFWYLRDILRSIKAEFGIVVEGRTDEELPEQMLTSFSCVGVENVNAKDFPVDEKFF